MARVSRAMALRVAGGKQHVKDFPLTIQIFSKF